MDPTRRRGDYQPTPKPSAQPRWPGVGGSVRSTDTRHGSGSVNTFVATRHSFSVAILAQVSRRDPFGWRRWRFLSGCARSPRCRSVGGMFGSSAHTTLSSRRRSADCSHLCTPRTLVSGHPGTAGRWLGPPALRSLRLPAAGIETRGGGASDQRFQESRPLLPLPLAPYNFFHVVY